MRVTLVAAEDARKRLEYNPETGTFVYRESGRAAGIDRGHGYLMICVMGRRYMCHRLAWLMVYGEFPAEGVSLDHINGSRSDNRIANLRLATVAENNRNAGLCRRNTTGIKGVSMNRRKFQAAVTVNGARVKRDFNTLQEAETAVKAARESLHGQFCRHA